MKYFRFYIKWKLLVYIIYTGFYIAVFYFGLSNIDLIAKEVMFFFCSRLLLLQILLELE